MENLRFLFRKARAFSRFIRPMRIPLHSSYTAFFLILSVFPALLLLLGLLKYTSFDALDLMDFLEGWLPESLMGTVSSLVDASYRHSSGTVISVSVLAALWSASRGMYGLRSGLNAVYGIPEYRGYWRKRGISMLYTASFLLMLSATLVLHVFGTAIVDYLWMATDPALMTVMGAVDLRFFLLLILQTLLFSTMYAWLPGQKRSLRGCLPGAALASVGWLVFSKLFSIYVSHFTKYTNIYGSIYALALGMLWLYFCICIFFYGGIINRVLRSRQNQHE